MAENLPSPQSQQIASELERERILFGEEAGDVSIMGDCHRKCPWTRSPLCEAADELSFEDGRAESQQKLCCPSWTSAVYTTPLPHHGVRTAQEEWQYACRVGEGSCSPRVAEGSP